VQLVRIDQVLVLAVRKVDLLVECLARAGQVDDEEAAVGSLGRRLDARSSVSSTSSAILRGTPAKLSQNRSIMPTIMRMTASRGWASSRSRPTAIVKAGSVRSSVVGVWIAGGPRAMSRLPVNKLQKLTKG
jgi:hypothetical protein